MLSLKDQNKSLKRKSHVFLCSGPVIPFNHFLPIKTNMIAFVAFELYEPLFKSYVKKYIFFFLPVKRAYFVKIF